MRIRVTVLLAATALAALAPAALARSPLKRADMKTIRKDARTHAISYAHAYGAKTYKVTCAKTNPYSARCKVRLIDVRAGTHDCTITLIYVVTRTHSIEGNLGKDGCA